MNNNRIISTIAIILASSFAFTACWEKTDDAKATEADKQNSDGNAEAKGDKNKTDKTDKEKKDEEKKDDGKTDATDDK